MFIQGRSRPESWKSAWYYRLYKAKSVPEGDWTKCWLMSPTMIVCSHLCRFINSSRLATKISRSGVPCSQSLPPCLTPSPPYVPNSLLSLPPSLPSHTPSLLLSLPPTLPLPPSLPLPPLSFFLNHLPPPDAPLPAGVSCPGRREVMADGEDSRRGGRAWLLYHAHR